jgi:hypothetical protein
MIQLRILQHTLGVDTIKQDVAMNYLLLSGMRLSDTATGLPYLRVEPRVDKGLTITSVNATVAGETYTTSRLSLKLYSVADVPQGFTFVQDLTVGMEAEYFLRLNLGGGLEVDPASGQLRVKLGTNLTYNGTTGALDASGGGGGGGSGTVSGTTNYLAKFTASTVVGNSLLYDNGTNVGIARTDPAYKLDVNGDIRAVAALRSGGLITGTADATRAVLGGAGYATGSDAFVRWDDGPADAPLIGAAAGGSVRAARVGKVYSTTSTTVPSVAFGGGDYPAPEGTLWLIVD